MISGSSVLLDLPRSQRNGAPRRLRCRRACGSTRGLCSSAGVRTPDSGHTDSLVRLDNNRSPLSRWDDLFYFAERVSNKISSSGQRRGRRRSAVNHFRVKALGRTQPPGPKPLVGHLRTPILGVFFRSARVVVVGPAASPPASAPIGHARPTAAGDRAPLVHTSVHGPRSARKSSIRSMIRQFCSRTWAHNVTNRDGCQWARTEEKRGVLCRETEV